MTIDDIVFAVMMLALTIFYATIGVMTLRDLHLPKFVGWSFLFCSLLPATALIMILMEGL